MDEVKSFDVQCMLLSNKQQILGASSPVRATRNGSDLVLGRHAQNCSRKEQPKDAELIADTPQPGSNDLANHGAT